MTDPFLDPEKVTQYLQDRADVGDGPVTIKTTATRMRGSVRVGVDFEAIALPDELTEGIVEGVRERIDARKIHDHTELGTVTVDSDTGEASMDLSDEYLKDSEAAQR